MTEAELREAVIAEALTWLRTPFRDCQAVKGSGVDCGMLPLEVFSRCGVIERFHPGHYSTQVHLNKTEEEQRRLGLVPYIDFVRRHARRIEEREVRKGDLVIYVMGKAFAHSAIVIAWPDRIIHAVKGLGVILDDAGRNGRLMRRPHEFYSLILPMSANAEVA